MAWAYPSNITGFVDLFQFVNDDILSGTLGILMLIATWFIFYITMQWKYDEEQSALYSSFVTALSSVFLWILTLVSFKVMLFFVLITFFIGIYAFYKRSREG